MSTAAVSSSSIHQGLQTYFQARDSELRKLGQALESGDLAQAQQAYGAIQSMAQNGPFDGNAFKLGQRQQDFAAVGQALQSGDLAGAQQALEQLRATVHQHPNNQPRPAVVVNLSGSSSSPSSAASATSNPQSSGVSVTV